MIRYPAIDDLFEQFRMSAPAELRVPIRQLACTLGLAPDPNVPWSQVFNHEVTLAAPWVIAQALPGSHAQHVRSASLAHLLAVIEAFGTDRILDGQVEATATLSAVLAEVRTARDRALGNVIDLRAAQQSYAVAQWVTHAAIHRERDLLARRTSISLREYHRISAGKQSVGMPACLGLARASGCSAREIASLRQMLMCVWMGLQAHDDVADWQDDLANGGAWAVNVAHGLLDAEPPSSKDGLVGYVHASGALESLLHHACRQMRAARRRAAALGARRLADWCQVRESDLVRWVEREREHPGIVLRARALAALEREVLG